jgi:hypothetical protein
MAKLFQRPVRVLLAAGICGFGVWHGLGTNSALKAIDRTLFQLGAESFANPPFFISGDGSHASPWSLRMLASPGSKSAVPPPTVLGIDDDRDGVFQTSPPSPVDYAVIFRNLHRLGTRHLAHGMVMAWDDPDPIARTALDTRMDQFDSVVTVSPLARGASMEEMPAAFVRASLPIEDVKGDVSRLPIVNRMPVPGTVLGDRRSLAGFSILESESPTEKTAPLVARWGSRVVFAFPVVAVLAEQGLAIDGVELSLGSHLKLGPEGPVIPIDESGGISLPWMAKPVSIPAKFVLDAEEMRHSRHVLIRDERTSAQAVSGEFPSRVAVLISAIRGESGLSAARQFNRLSGPAEAVLLGLLVVVLTWISSRRLYTLRVGFAVIFGLIVVAQLVALGFSCWMPGFPMLAVMLGGSVLAWPFARQNTERPISDRGHADGDLRVKDASKEELPLSAGEPNIQKAADVASLTTSTASDEEVGVESTEPSPPSEKPQKKVAKKAAKKVAKKVAKKAAKKTARQKPKSPPSAGE